MYASIDCNRGRYTVGMMAKLLDVSPRSYYDFKKGIHPHREQKREMLEQLIQRTYATAKGRYGVPRIAAEIVASGVAVSANTVSKYMKRMGLRSKLSRKFRNPTYPEYTLRMCPNHLDRQFRVDAPGKVWVSDITCIHTTHVFIYLTTVMDLYDRKIAGWSMSNNLTTKDTASRAYQMAIRRRRPTEGMIFHSDRGVQYASEEFRNTLVNNVVQSMSLRATTGIMLLPRASLKASNAS